MKTTRYIILYNHEWANGGDTIEDAIQRARENYNNYGNTYAIIVDTKPVYTVSDKRTETILP